VRCGTRTHGPSPRVAFMCGPRRLNSLPPPLPSPLRQGVSFLPRAPKAAYAQMPYEAISAEQYGRALEHLRAAAARADAGGSGGFTRERLVEDEARGDVQAPPDSFCDTSSCEIGASVAPGVAAPDDGEALHKGGRRR
jgi:hypothetical protein